jgi:hypothetical protein
VQPTLVIPQALVIRTAVGPTLVARSPGFDFPMEEEALRTAVRFGPRPPGVKCPAAVFACPLGTSHVAIVQVADRPGGDEPLAFRFLVIDRRAFQGPFDRFFGDPFRAAESFPPDWSARNELTDIEWFADRLPRREVAAVREILRKGDSPALLGTAQALIDGSRVALEHAQATDTFVRDVWQLLPDRIRAELWPASFAFAADLPFHVVALPGTAGPGFLSVDQTRDYPEGKYESGLQSAAESGDQVMLDQLLARKTSREVLHLAVGMILFAVVAAVLLKVL